MKIKLFIILLNIILLFYCIEHSDKSVSQNAIQYHHFVDSLIAEYKLPESTIVSTKIYGAGDCYGKFITYKLKNTNSSITFDNFDCGEYGFKKKIFFFSNDSLKFVKSNIKDWHLSDAPHEISYSIKENIYDFTKDTLFQFSRSKETKDFYDTLLIDIPYLSKRIINFDSVLTAELENFEIMKSQENLLD